MMTVGTPGGGIPAVVAGLVEATPHPATAVPVLRLPTVLIVAGRVRRERHRLPLLRATRGQ
jgi:hypothetical protein